VTAASGTVFPLALNFWYKSRLQKRRLKISFITGEEGIWGFGSGVARYFDARSESSQWAPLAKIMNSRRVKLFIEFPYIWFYNLKFVEGRKSFFKI
jgi:hypothetical protein